MFISMELKDFKILQNLVVDECNGNLYIFKVSYDEDRHFQFQEWIVVIFNNELR